MYVRELLNLTLEAHLFALQLRLFATVDAALVLVSPHLVPLPRCARHSPELPDRLVHRALILPQLLVKAHAVPHLLTPPVRPLARSRRARASRARAPPPALPHQQSRRLLQEAKPRRDAVLRARSVSCCCGHGCPASATALSPPVPLPGCCCALSALAPNLADLVTVIGRDRKQGWAFKGRGPARRGRPAAALPCAQGSKAGKALVVLVFSPYLINNN